MTRAQATGTNDVEELLVELLLSNSLAWLVIFGISGSVVNFVPGHTLRRIEVILGPWCVGRGSRPRRFVYEKVLMVPSFKGMLPHVALATRATRLDRIGTRDPSHLQAWVEESVRAELVHWLVLACTPVFAFWNPLSGLVINGVFAVLSNMPCILAQRYNRPRVKTLLEKFGKSTRRRESDVVCGARSDGR